MRRRRPGWIGPRAGRNGPAPRAMSRPAVPSIPRDSGPCAGPGAAEPDPPGAAFGRLAPELHALFSRLQGFADRPDPRVEAAFRTLWVSAGRPGGDREIHQLALQAMGSCLSSRTLHPAAEGT